MAAENQTTAPIVVDKSKLVYVLICKAKDPKTGHEERYGCGSTTIEGFQQVTLPANAYDITVTLNQTPIKLTAEQVASFKMEPPVLALPPSASAAAAAVVASK